MNILIASSEAVPYIKTGGLADVAGSLLKELRTKKEKAFLVLPLYAAIKNNYKLHATGKAISVKMGNLALTGSIFASSKDENPEAYFIECDELYGRPELYGTSAGDYADNAIRFVFFSRAVLELCIAMRMKPDVIHCNDWQTALIPLYLKTLYKDSMYLRKTSSLFTVHNLGYQGIFGPSTLSITGLGREYFISERLEFYGKLNLMKAGLLYADLINTVSSTYAQEIQQPEYGAGLDGVMRKRADDLYGIINGIDYEQWDPSKDRLIPYHYGLEDLKGKARCRKTLCQEAVFEREKLPIVAIISRLSSQKGLELVLDSVEALIAMGLNIVVLGKGQDEYERPLKTAAALHKGRIFVRIGFQEELAHLFYAGSDFFLMPSQYEPCGLGQLIAMKYGTVPIARKTGGLADTIQDYDHMAHTGTGFLFSDYSPYAMQDAVKRALCVFNDKAHMKKMVLDVMKNNFSWSSSAERYLGLYNLAGEEEKMKLRTRLSFMLSIFFVLIALLSVGSITIFQRLSERMGNLRLITEEAKLYNELDRNIGSLVDVTKGWSLTNNSKYMKQYLKKKSDTRTSFENLSRVHKKTDDLDIIDKEIQQIIEYSDVVIGNRQPPLNLKLIEYLQNIDTIAVDITTRIAVMQEHSTNKILSIVTVGDEIKEKMVYYHAALIFFSSLATVFLIMSIRRAITVPFNELLKATEQISKGEMSYRIGMDRDDEFGTVAKRFDAMVTDLEASNLKITQKLKETQLLLCIAKLGGTTVDLKDALQYIVETIPLKLQHDNCALYLFIPEQKVFCIEASNVVDEDLNKECISFENAILSEMLTTLRPVIISDDGLNAENALLLKHYKTALAVPIIRDGKCVGLMLIRRAAPYTFSADELDTFMILSHSIESILRNSELFQATKKQLQKLSVLYEMSRAVTSVLDLGDLLKKIATEISRLLSSKGCILRLLEDNKLKIKSSYGLPEGVEQEMELSIGEGIAGWVAANDKPLLVEDANKMPQDMKISVISVKSVICVPLKAGGKVIGTLGLYDKYDLYGNLIPFTNEDMNTVEGFASISSIAIERSKIYESELNRERSFAEDRKRLKVLFDSVQGGIITLDRAYTITSVNKYIEEWVAVPAGELIGLNTLDIFHEKIGICPHCAAMATFETGEINSIMQSKGLNYAELTAYPIRNESGEIIESVVFIQDITERVLYQEETLGLYREVIQTKEYIESIISNSADAIVTSDMEGLVTSWNRGAEKVFDFSESEVIGKYLPFVPDFLLEKEKENIDRIKKGEVLKDIETLRRKKDESIIEVSLTLSPINDASGDVIGICGISRDISEKKRVEKELIRRNQEISRLFFISSAMRSTLELDRLLRMVLTAVTMSDGMGFNRAVLFLIDESKNVLKGFMGVGPASPEEAWKIWDDVLLQHKTLNEVMQEIATSSQKRDSFFERLSKDMEISLDEDGALRRAVTEKRPFNIQDVKDDPLVDTVLIQQFGTHAYAVVPLISRDKVIGLIWVDNYFNRKPILEADMQFLASFSNYLASAIESARLFEQVTMAEQQLENIFESISDMVYFVSKDYEIKNINRAVSDKIGKPQSEILGKKCYEIFHGMNEPLQKCPHHKTVSTKKAYIEELEEPHLGGTFLTSSSPIFDSSGGFMGTVHVVRDISELKNLREKLVMSEKMAALGEVAAKVAHEIRNPLVSVGGFAKRLEKKLEGNLKEYAGIIVKEVARLESILKEILGFVKEVRLSREYINFNVLVDDVLQLMASDIEERGIVIVRDYTPSPDVYVDPQRVKEAIVNIISNAIQSITGSGYIYITTHIDKKDAVLEIRDTGRGIPEGDLPFIFNPFFTTKSSGTGLGLAITHRIIQEHNGRVEVETTVDKGTIFRVYIPIKEGER